MKYYGSIKLMRKLVSHSFVKQRKNQAGIILSPSYNDKQPHFTGAPTFYWGGGTVPSAS